MRPAIIGTGDTAPGAASQASPVRGSHLSV